jgi:hypothetical protein
MTLSRSCDDTSYSLSQPQPFLLVSKHSARRGSPLAPSDGISITTRSVPATPLAEISTTILSHLANTPGMPISLGAQNFGARLTLQGTHQTGESPMSGDLQPSLSKSFSYGQYDN